MRAMRWDEGDDLDNLDDLKEYDERDEGEARCFRCGRMQPRETLRALDADVPAAFRGKPLCVVCMEAVRGKKGGGWWARAIDDADSVTALFV